MRRTGRDRDVDRAPPRCILEHRRPLLESACRNRVEQQSDGDEGGGDHQDVAAGSGRNRLTERRRHAHARRNIAGMRLHRVVYLVAAVMLGTRGSSAQRRPVEWPVYGGGPESMRYSTLTQINRDNVSHLKVAWTFDASDGVMGSELEVNPIVVNGVLYATTVSLNAVA